MGYDYLGEIVWPDYRGWDEGMLDIAGFPKPEYYLRKSYWSDEPVVHIGVRQGPDRDFDWSPRNVADHWNWQGRDQDTLEVYAYSNCDEVELRAGSRSGGTTITLCGMSPSKPARFRQPVTGKGKRLPNTGSSRPGSHMRSKYRAFFATTTLSE